MVMLTSAAAVVITAKRRSRDVICHFIRLYVPIMFMIK